MAPSPAQPITIADNGGKNQYTYSVYLQDEWKLLSNLTLNYGLRGDDVNGFRDEMQLSPRVNLVWVPFEGNTVHLGYARYFTPPPFELVGSTSIAKFVGTSAAPNALQDTTPFAERQNYFDIGAQQKLGGLFKGLTLGVRRLLSPIAQPDRRGPVRRADHPDPVQLCNAGLSRASNSAPATPPVRSALYANFTAEKAQGENITSSQFSFDPGDLAYIRNHYIYLDHDQTYSASAGVSYRISTRAHRSAPT